LILGTVSDTGSRELFTLAVLAMALALTVRIFESLGASPEQIDREREHVEASFRGG
jgi:predicted Kef-type K+ transport protein